MAIRQDQQARTPTAPPPPPTTTAENLPAGWAELEQLKALRQQLEAGQIPVSQFLEQGKALGQAIFSEQLRLGAGGSSSAREGDRLRNAFAAANTGFRQEATGDPKTAIKTDLPQQYQQALREELIPANITGAERQALLDEIPLDIGFDTDRFQIEREGIRQKLQTQKTASSQAALRAQRLQDLTKLLSDRDTRMFKEAIPDIAEEAQGKGILNSSGYGEALARERSRLQANSADAIAQQALSDRDLDANGLAAILATGQKFQSDALSREFSLNDYNKQTNDALRLAMEQRPQSSGKSNGEKWAQGIGIIASGASAASNAKSSFFK